MLSEGIHCGYMRGVLGTRVWCVGGRVALCRFAVAPLSRGNHKGHDLKLTTFSVTVLSYPTNRKIRGQNMGYFKTEEEL